MIFIHLKKKCAQWWLASLNFFFYASQETRKAVVQTFVLIPAQSVSAPIGNFGPVPLPHLAADLVQTLDTWLQ